MINNLKNQFNNLFNNNENIYKKDNKIMSNNQNNNEEIINKKLNNFLVLVQDIKILNDTIKTDSHSQLRFKADEISKFKSAKLKNYTIKKEDLISNIFSKFKPYINIRFDNNKTDIKLAEHEITVDEEILNIIIKRTNIYSKVEINDTRVIDDSYYITKSNKILLLISEYISNLKLAKGNVLRVNKSSISIIAKNNYMKHLGYMMEFRSKLYPMSLLIKKTFNISKIYDLYKAIVASLIYLKSTYKSNNKIRIYVVLFNKLIEKLGYLHRNIKQIFYYHINYYYKNSNILTNKKEFTVIIYQLHKIETFVSNILTKKYYSFIEKDNKIISNLIDILKYEFKLFIDKEILKVINTIITNIQKQ